MKLKSPPPTDQEKVSRLIDVVHMDNPAIALEPELSGKFHPVSPAARDADLGNVTDQVSKAVHDALQPVFNGGPPLIRPNPSGPPPTGGAGPLPPAGLPGGPSSKPPARAFAEDSYRAFERTMYPTSGGKIWSYERMVMRVRGFGGVVFGNEVSAPASLPSVIGVSWLSGGVAPAPTSPDVSEQWGRLIFRLKDGQTLMSHFVRADAVAAAKAVTIGHPDRNDNALGLVGFTGQFVVDSPDSDNDKMMGLSFVVHPDFVATRLGHSMMVLDTLPMIAEQFVRQVADSGMSKQQADLLSDILGGKFGALGQYKFTDVKLEINADETRVVSVRRMESDAPDAKPELRSTAYITLLSFDGDHPRRENTIPIYPIIPVLIQVSDPFARANEFAEVFALLRWAKANGAKWFGPDPESPKVQAATALVVGDDGNYTFGPSAAAMSQAMAKRFYGQAKAIAVKSGNACLIGITDDFYAEFSALIVSSDAIRIAGSVAEVLGAAFSANPSLAAAYPEAARNALVASSFAEIGSSNDAREKAYDWIDANLDKLEHVVPGLKARAAIAESRLRSFAELNLFFSDSSPLFNYCTDDKYKGDLDSMVNNAVRNGNNERTVDDKIASIEEKGIPGFGRWFALEERLFQDLIYQ